MSTITRDDPAPPVIDAGYRPHLDGIRALAVYLVVVFHAGVTSVEGGFIGVDVFFVISGYLVTQVLLRDARGRGGIRFGRFYARRIRRLLPAAAVALLLIGLVYSSVASPVDVAAAADAIRSCFLYVANWYFIDQATDYFAEGFDRSPVLHFWSLAVEEQFYLCWPLLFGGLWRFASRRGAVRDRLVASVIVLAGVTSAGWALLLRTEQPSRAYFGTEARAYQLLAGAVLAVLPSVIARASRGRLASPAAWAGLAGILLLASSVVDVDPIVRGIAVTLAAVLLIVGLEAAPSGALARAFSVAPVVYLGRISYGTYLWHWPIVVIASELDLAVSPVPMAGITFLIATGVAALSYELLEMPIRRSARLDRHRRGVVVAGLAASVVCALVLVPVVTDGDDETVVAAADTPAGFTPVPASFDAEAVFEDRFGETVDCVDGRPEDCTVVDGDGPHVLLIGDSNAQMLVPAFVEMAKAEGLRLSLSVTTGCPWQKDFYWLTEEARVRCKRIKEDAYDRVIPALDPDVVVAVNVYFSNISEVPSDEGRGPEYSAATEATLPTLVDDHRQVVLVKSLPHTSTLNPRECLAEAEVVEECRFVMTEVGTWPDDLQSDLAEEDDHVTFVDWDRMLCPFEPICDPMAGDTVVFWNGNHITADYSEQLAEPIAVQLRELGLI